MQHLEHSFNLSLPSFLRKTRTSSGPEDPLLFAIKAFTIKGVLKFSVSNSTFFPQTLFQTSSNEFLNSTILSPLSVFSTKLTRAKAWTNPVIKVLLYETTRHNKPSKHRNVHTTTESTKLLRSPWIFEVGLNLLQLLFRVSLISL